MVHDDCPDHITIGLPLPHYKQWQWSPLTSRHVFFLDSSTLSTTRNLYNTTATLYNPVSPSAISPSMKEHEASSLAFEYPPPDSYFLKQRHADTLDGSDTEADADADTVYKELSLLAKFEAAVNEAEVPT